MNTTKQADKALVEELIQANVEQSVVAVAAHASVAKPAPAKAEQVADIPEGWMLDEQGNLVMIDEEDEEKASGANLSAIFGEEGITGAQVAAGLGAVAVTAFAADNLGSDDDDLDTSASAGTQGAESPIAPVTGPVTENLAGTPLEGPAGMVLGPLEDALAVAGGGGDAAGPTGTPLDMVLGPVADAAGMGEAEAGADAGAEAGPTGTPLDAVLAPLADAAGGGDDSGADAGPTGTPLDAVLAPLADAAGGGDDAGADAGPTGTPLDAVLAPLADAAGGGDDAGADAGPTGTPLDAALTPVLDGVSGTPLEGPVTTLTDGFSTISSAGGGGDLPFDPSSLPV